MWRALSILIAALMTASCASPGLPPPERPIQRAAPVGLMIPCLPPEAPEQPTKGALLQAYVETAARLHTCRDRVAGWIEWQEKAIGSDRPGQ